MTENTAPRFTADYMAANRIEINDNAITDGTSTEVEYFVLFEGNGCACGCGEAVANAKRNFRPGHDQRLMGILVRAEREGLEVSWMAGGVMISGTATDYARLVLGDAGVSKLAGYIANEPKRARKARADRAEVDPAADAIVASVKPAADPLPATVKIGRWEYPVIDVERDGNGKIVGVTYKNRQGSEMVAREWGKLS